MDLQLFKKKPILGILRGATPDIIVPLVETVIGAGLESLEITMNTPGAPALIREAVRAAGGRMVIGAGTVLSVKDLQSALEAGATFIVMPVLVEEIVAHCTRHKIPVFPGALTPQEIYHAWDRGATMVKVFPSGFFGPAYFKEIKGPFQNIELLACGGVTPENLRDYFSCGADAVAFGGSVFKKEWLAAGDFAGIGDAIRKFVDAYKAHEKRNN